MTNPDGTERIFPTAEQDAAFSCHVTPSPQTLHPHYRLAFTDADFMLRDELRPVRLQLELLKPEIVLQEYHIASTIVFYGSARIPEPGTAYARAATAHSEREHAVAARLAEKSHYYVEARRLAERISSIVQPVPDERNFVVTSGGGPSIMEAANRGAADAGAPSIGLNIVLEHEQAPNMFVTPGLSFQFHYFAIRKMHFLMRARALCVFPGGFGTLDELFEVLTLIQTRKIKPVPVLLFGEAFWRRIVNFEALAEEGVIAFDDLSLFRFVETADEAWAYLAQELDLRLPVPQDQPV